MTITVQNLKCGGCGNTIKTRLNRLPFIKDLEINVAESRIHFTELTAEELGVVQETLEELGYPRLGDSNTLLKKAKSYISCAQGRF